MQLTVRDLTRFFDVPEKTIYRWIEEKGLPSYEVNGRYRFNKSELLEWSIAQHIKTTGHFFNEPEEPENALPNLSEALEAGGFYYDVPGATTAEVLGAVVASLQLPKEIDRKSLLHLLLAREKLASTGIGDGIAIPHVRDPIVVHVARPMINLSFLGQPVDFQALDKKPVRVLFSLISPTVRIHLHMLSRLSFALHDARFKGAVTARAPREVILAEARRVEDGLRSAGTVNGEAVSEHD